MTKSALIVDDSASARLVLKRVLESHDLAVDACESAEDALEFLESRRPDVIFMDHMMPGMDGFEAVRVIKKNPATATIPIMMYTSQEGEVYVGQARALGAVGVLPKQVEPVEVSKVLKSLRVIQPDDSAAQPRVVENVAATPYEGLELDVRELIEDLFEQQREILRRDLARSSADIVARVAEEVRPPHAEESQAPAARQSGAGRNLAIAVLLTLAALFGWGYWNNEQRIDELIRVNEELQGELQLALGTATPVEQAIDAVTETLRESAVRGLEWGINLDPSRSFGELPLSDTLLARVEELENRLREVGYSGAVRIETHVGDFCMGTSGADGFALAGGSVAASDCSFIGWSVGEAYERGLQQTVAFANFVRLAPQRSGGRIRYEIVSLGNIDPLIPYPASPEGMTAAEWNRVAAANNRVEITLLAD